METILEFRIKEEIFGIDAERIDHILEVPHITPIPLVDDAIKGVSVILGKIITIIDLGKVLNLGEVEISDKSRLLVSKELGFLVEEVKNIKQFNKDNFEESNDELIKGFLRENDYVVQILDIDKIVEKLGVKFFKPQEIDFSIFKDEKENITEESKRFLFFKAGGENFAIDIEILRELIDVKEITPIANNDEILGVITLRDEVIPVIDMNKILGFKSKITPKSKILIATFEGKALAFLVEEIGEVKNIPIRDIEKNLIEDEIIEGIYKKEVTTIISSDFIKKLIRKYAKEYKEEKLEEKQMREVVVFKIDKEEFAFDIDIVQEIIKYEKPTPIPEAPDVIEGVLNLRGNIIPIISLPKKLGFKEIIDENTKIIVCNVKNEKIGFVVDDVKEILSVDIKNIVQSKGENTIFDEIIKIGDRVILKIDPRKILKDELDKIISIGKENG